MWVTDYAKPKPILNADWHSPLWNNPHTIFHPFNNDWSREDSKSNALRRHG